MKKIFALILWTIPAVNGALSLLGIGSFNLSGNSILFATNYYFSSISGNDENSGLNSSSPWRSMDKLRQITKAIQPGDVIYFERGSSWDNAYFEIRNLKAGKGNPVIFTSYGTGSKPCFKGSKRINSLVQKGNIWSKVDSDLPDYNETVYLRAIPFVYINGVKQECSRYPNQGYLTTKTTGVKNYLDDNTQSWTNNHWTNGLAVVRNVNWRWCSRRITSNTGNRLNFEDMDRDYERGNTPYLIRNHLLACDKGGEWAQQNDTLWIYSTADLNDQLVEVPVIDTIIKVIDCSNIEFKGLQIEKANVYGIYLNNSTSTISDCSISDVGGMLVFAANHSSLLAENNSFTGGRRGGIFYDTSHGKASGNTFSNMAFDGVDNTEHTYGPCIASWYCDGNFYSSYNRMDSINLAYNLHWSNDSVWIENNYITNFGLTLEDCGAIYFGSDFTGPNQGAYKYVRKNIVKNAHNRFVHGIYIDSGSNFVECDSNTVAHTNLAVFIHVSKFNTIKHTNIVDPAFGMDIYAWNQAIRLDEYSYQYGGEGSAVVYNTVTDNDVVLGQTIDETAVVTLNVSNLGSNTIDNNRYFDPFTSDQDVFLISQNYSEYYYQNIDTWRNNTGKDLNSKYNPINHTFSSVSGIDADDFVLLLCNPSKKDSVFDLRRYGAIFLDVDGNLVANTVTVPSYYSKILFYKERTDVTNQQPYINNSSFSYYIGETDNENIGKIQATDVNSYQKLSYSITGGNTGALIGINANDGTLYLTNKNVNIPEETTLLLTIEVSDDGSPSLKASAQAAITLYPMNNPPIFNNQDFTVNESSGLSAYIGRIVATDPQPTR